MGYKHGAYGEITDSRATTTTQSDSVSAYIGTAPINLIRGYADLNLINTPIKISNMSEAQGTLGYSNDWGSFTLCEVFGQHFDNSVGNIGPIYVVNVLDPDTHKAEEKVTEELSFNSKRAEFSSSNIILDTFAIADMAEGVDYALEYNFAKGTAVVKLLKDDVESPVQCSYYVVDKTLVTEEDIIGQATESGEYHGLHAMKLLYQYHNAIPNILAAPGWSHFPAVYKAMVSIVQKLNGHWDGFVNADIPLKDKDGNLIDTRAKALEWKAANGYNSEFSKVYWPQIKDGSGRVFHLSGVGQATMQRVDLSHNAIPFESPSNKEIMATCQYFGEGSKNKGFDQQAANNLNENGITTACFWGGKWVLWGPHTAAFKYGADNDGRAIFDANIRMLMYITNDFQQTHGTEIDSPMIPQDKDAILNQEREKLEMLASLGALIGTPTVDFVEAANPVSDMVNGDFVWDVSATPTPPFKSATARVCYTDEGFQSFFGIE